MSWFTHEHWWCSIVFLVNVYQRRHGHFSRRGFWRLFPSVLLLAGLGFRLAGRHLDAHPRAPWGHSSSMQRTLCWSGNGKAPNCRWIFSYDFKSWVVLFNPIHLKYFPEISVIFSVPWLLSSSCNPHVTHFSDTIWCHRGFPEKIHHVVWL